MFITLERPSADMTKEAVSAGFYRSPFTNQDYPRLQILTIADLLNGAQINMPASYGTFKQAQRIKPESPQQPELL